MKTKTTYYAILDKHKQKYLLWLKKDGGDNRILLFKYPIQAENYIKRQLGNSINFTIKKFEER